MNRFALLAAALLLAACRPRPALEAEPMKDIRPLGAVAHGDCVEARRRAAAEPDLDVDRLPAIVKQAPAPFQRMPHAVRSVVAKKGAVVKVNVVIDTTGKPDMKTFAVVEATHPWLAENVKGLMPRWSYTPAELAGCKVARVYKFSATAPARRRAQ